LRGALRATKQSQTSHADILPNPEIATTGQDAGLAMTAWTRNYTIERSKTWPTVKIP
jgi:hypothetical protein